MELKELEHLFDRAIKYSFSRKKIIFLLPFLLTAGGLLVFGHSLARQAGRWVQLSLTFTPLLIASGLLLASGVVLSKAYYYDLKQAPFKLRHILRESWQMLINLSYLSLPLVLAFLIVWILMGIFYMLTELPVIGEFMSVLFAFGPFLLSLCAILLSVLSLLIVFFVAPHAALSNGQLELKWIQEIYQRAKNQILSHTLMFIISLVPFLIVLSILSLAVYLSSAPPSDTASTFSTFMKSFFVMIPFCFLLAPPLLFFINFATEYYAFDKKKMKQISN